MYLRSGLGHLGDDKSLNYCELQARQQTTKSKGFFSRRRRLTSRERQDFIEKCMRNRSRSVPTPSRPVTPAPAHPAPAQPPAQTPPWLKEMMQNQGGLLQSLVDLLRAQPTHGQKQTASAPTPSKRTDAEIYKAVKKEARKEEVAQEGGEVRGSGGRSVKEMLTAGEQPHWTPSEQRNKPGNHWTNLGPAPTGFDEQKYLAKHPDVAKAVRLGVMPSGLYHYLKFGKSEGRPLAGWKAFGGFRPGFLNGVFSSWRSVEL